MDQLEYEKRKFERALAFMERHKCERCSEVSAKLKRVAGLFELTRVASYYDIFRAGVHTFRCNL